MVMGGKLARLYLEDARLVDVAIRCVDKETTAHAQMHDQRLAGGEIGHEILGPARKRQDRLADEPLDKAIGKRKAQVRPPLLDLFEPRPNHGRFQPAAHGLDFGQFRHGGSFNSRPSYCSMTAGGKPNASIA
eukprot:gene8383-biopygen7448